MWKTWMKIALFVMNVWAYIFLTLFYIIFIIPFAFFLKIFFRSALLGHGSTMRKNTYWVERRKIVPTLAWAKEQ